MEMKSAQKQSAQSTSTGQPASEGYKAAESSYKMLPSMQQDYQSPEWKAFWQKMYAMFSHAVSPGKANEAPTHKKSKTPGSQGTTGRLPLKGMAKIKVAKGCATCRKYAHSDHMTANWAYEFAGKYLKDHVHGNTVTIDKAFINAVKEFQGKHKMHRDGILGPGTMSALWKDTVGTKKYEEDGKTGIARVTQNETSETSTGKRLQDYRFRTIQTYDKGVVSYGIIQFTIGLGKKGGSLKQVLEEYVQLKEKSDKKAGIKTDKTLNKVKGYLSKSMWSKIVQEGKQHYHEYDKWRRQHGKRLNNRDAERMLSKYPHLRDFYYFLKRFKVDQSMRTAQYRVATKMYYSQAVAYAAGLGLHSQAAITCVLDATVQHGGGGAKSLARSAMKAHTITLSSGKKIHIDAGVVGSPKKKGGTLTEWEVVMKFNQVRINKYHKSNYVVNRTKKLSKEIEKYLLNTKTAKK